MYSGQVFIGLPEHAAAAFGNAGNPRPNERIGDTGFDIDSIYHLHLPTPNRLSAAALAAIRLRTRCECAT